MRNKLFQEALDNVSEKSRQKIRDYTDAIDMAVNFGEWLKVNAFLYRIDDEIKKWWLEKDHCYYSTEELFQIFKTE